MRCGPASDGRGWGCHGPPVGLLAYVTVPEGPVVGRRTGTGRGRTRRREGRVSGPLKGAVEGSPKYNLEVKPFPEGGGGGGWGTGLPSRGRGPWSLRRRAHRTSTVPLSGGNRKVPHPLLSLPHSHHSHRVKGEVHSSRIPHLRMGGAHPRRGGGSTLGRSSHRSVVDPSDLLSVPVT